MGGIERKVELEQELGRRDVVPLGAHERVMASQQEHVACCGGDVAQGHHLGANNPYHRRQDG